MTLVEAMDEFAHETHWMIKTSDWRAWLDWGNYLRDHKKSHYRKNVPDKAKFKTIYEHEFIKKSHIWKGNPNDADI